MKVTVELVPTVAPNEAQLAAFTFALPATAVTTWGGYGPLVVELDVAHVDGPAAQALGLYQVARRLDQVGIDHGPATVTAA